MRAVLFCLVLSANALPEAQLRGRVKDHLRDRDLSVPEDAKNHYANTDASSDEISATNLEEGGFLGKLLRRFGLASSEETAGGRVGGAPGPGEGGDPAASIKGTLSHEDAPKDTKSKADTAYATGGHAQPVLETEVSPRDQDKVSQHKTQGADAALAELADAHNKGGDAIDAAHGNGDPAASIKGTLSHVKDAPQTITSEAAAFDDKGLSGSTARKAAAEMVKSRLATQTTRPVFEQGRRRLDSCVDDLSSTDIDGDDCSDYVGNRGWCTEYDDPPYFKANDQCCACGGGVETKKLAKGGRCRSGLNVVAGGTFDGARSCFKDCLEKYGDIIDAIDWQRATGSCVCHDACLCREENENFDLVLRKDIDPQICTGNEQATPSPTAVGKRIFQDRKELKDTVRKWINDEDRDGLQSTYGDIEDWDTHRVTDMSFLFCVKGEDGDTQFQQCHDEAFNQVISNWDTIGAWATRRTPRGVNKNIYKTRAETYPAAALSTTHRTTRAAPRRERARRRARVEVLVAQGYGKYATPGEEGLCAWLQRSGGRAVTSTRG